MTGVLVALALVVCAAGPGDWLSATRAIPRAAREGHVAAIREYLSHPPREMREAALKSVRLAAAIGHAGFLHLLPCRTPAAAE